MRIVTSGAQIWNLILETRSDIKTEKRARSDRMNLDYIEIKVSRTPKVH